MGDFVKAAGRGGRAMARTSTGGSAGKLEEGLEFFCRISGDWRKRGSYRAQALHGPSPPRPKPSTAQAFHGPSLGLRPGPKRAYASYPPYRHPMSSAGEEIGGGGPMRVVVWLAACMAFTATLAHAEDDMAAMISQYRRQHGLSAVKTDPQLTAIAERQAQAMAATGIMDHSVAGSFHSRIAGARTGAAAENIAVGSKTWSETSRMWQKSPGHNANLLQSEADSVGVAVVRNEQTRWKTYWAMVIADKSPKKKGRKVTADAAPQGDSGSSATSEDPITALKNTVCKLFC